MRCIAGGAPLAALGNAATVPASAVIAAGPTSRATYFAAGPMRAWGIGILPAGWARYVPIPAEALADRFCDGAAHPAFAALAPLGEALRAIEDAEAAARPIDDHFVAFRAREPRDDPIIGNAHAALLDGAHARESDG